MPENPTKPKRYVTPLPEGARDCGNGLMQLPSGGFIRTPDEVKDVSILVFGSWEFGRLDRIGAALDLAFQKRGITRVVYRNAEHPVSVRAVQWATERKIEVLEISAERHLGKILLYDKVISGAIGFGFDASDQDIIDGLWGYRLKTWWPFGPPHAGASPIGTGPD